MSPTIHSSPNHQHRHQNQHITTTILLEKEMKQNGTLSPPTNVSDEDEPQMSTPDDPVIHSPPSIGSQLHNGYGQASLSVSKLEESGDCESPENANLDPNDVEARRRQKTCRVCGDHATGYNFNVITCESCKAFFRRNALRPKEFKCPYTEDCEINAVSRRFCQKCRLRKCFAVGMKKEWILNEEQLRRRKNSRLNNMTGQSKLKNESSMPSPQNYLNDLARQQAAVKAMQCPISISPMDLGSLSGRGIGTSIISPPSYAGMLSPSGSATGDSPPSRPMPLTPASAASTTTRSGHCSPDAYESNIMMQQRLRGLHVGNMAEQRKQMTARLSTDDGDAPPMKRSVYSPSETQRPSHLPATAARPVPGMAPAYGDVGGTESKSPTTMGAEQLAHMTKFFDNTIIDALKIDSPESAASLAIHSVESADQFGTYQSDQRLSYQLNAAELRALDQVNEAFKGINDPVEQGRQKMSFLKREKSPADIMNIMDVTMRRLVKMAKKIPAFNDMSQDGKFALLKGGMVEMLTVRGVTRYDSSTRMWRSPVVQGGEVPFDMFDKLNKDIRGDQKCRVKQFFSVFHEDIRNNDMAISLIILIVLFSQRDVIQEASDKKLIQKTQDHYYNLFNRYLESLYGEDANHLVTKLPDALLMLKEISQNAGALFLGTVNTSEAEALPREIFKVE